MGQIFKRTGKEMAKRWHEKMPRFFYWLVVVACGIGGTAAAINFGVPALGGTLHEWWTDVYTYIIGGCIATVFVCKFTVAGGYKDIDPDVLTRGNAVLDKDIEHMNGESPMPPVNQEPNEIDPYDDSPDA